MVRRDLQHVVGGARLAGFCLVYASSPTATTVKASISPVGRLLTVEASWSAPAIRPALADGEVGSIAVDSDLGRGYKQTYEREGAGGGG